jgi:hypothetical protein
VYRLVRVHSSHYPVPSRSARAAPGQVGVSSFQGGSRRRTVSGPRGRFSNRIQTHEAEVQVPHRPPRNLAQLLPLREFADAQGWTVSGEFADRAPAKELRTRTAWREQLDQAARQRVDLVLIWRIDRCNLRSCPRRNPTPKAPFPVAAQKTVYCQARYRFAALTPPLSPSQGVPLARTV